MRAINEACSFYEEQLYEVLFSIISECIGAKGVISNKQVKSLDKEIRKIECLLKSEIKYYTKKVKSKI